MYCIVDCACPQCKRVVHFNRLKPAPIGNVPLAERILNEEEHMKHTGDTAEESEEEHEITVTDHQPVIIPQDTVEINQPPEITVRMDQPVIIPQDTVEINQPPIALLPTPPVIDVPRQNAVPRNAALPIPSENSHRDAVPAGLRRSSRKTKQPERYGDPINTIPDVHVWTHLIEEGAM